MKHFLTLGWLYGLLLLNLPLFAQQGVVVSGRVMDVDSDETLVGAKVAMKGKVVGTSTDTDGNFKLLTGKEELPLTLLISMPSYETKEVLVNGPTDILVVRLKYQALMLGQEVVVAASRVEESVLKSPVSIEKLDIRDIQSAPPPIFYDQLANLKGMVVSAQGLLFKSINPRGFGINGNPRTVQLIDGIDNQAPVFNFSAGNAVGLPEIDAESIEVLPGVASALYGPNALNGIILMNSKSPFEYRGLSAIAKGGVTHLDGEDNDPSLFQHYALRYAKSFNNRLAFKLVGEFIQVADFRGVDYRDQDGALGDQETGLDPIDRSDRRTYDGVNVYGDPSINLGVTAQNDNALQPIQDLFPTGEEGTFTPTGYTESQITDNTAESIKATVALHYRIGSAAEASLQYNYRVGTTVYTGNDRTLLDNFLFQTIKAEIRSPNFFLRAYTTSTTSDSYGLNTLATLINARTTIPLYIQTFAGARLQGLSVDESHAISRQASDALRADNLENGRFQELFDSLRTVPISQGGAGFIDRSRLWHYEGMYNFSELTDLADIIVGANFRRYAPNTEGTLFALQDNGDEFTIDEWGAYVQASKSVFNDKLDVTTSIRYDKNENFSGQLSPRISGVYAFLDGHNLRASFQRGFRIPTIQDQLINLNVVTRWQIGNNPVLVDRYNLRTNQVYLASSVEQAQERFRSTGDVNSAVALLEPVTFPDFETEKVSTFELGYKGVVQQRLFADAYYYYNIYTDFIANVEFIQSIGPENRPDANQLLAPPFIGEEDPVAIVQEDIGLQRFGSYTNASGTINAHGWAVGLNYRLYKDFVVGADVSYNQLLNQDNLIDQGVQTGFNTPEWMYNLSITNRKVKDRLGFSLFWHWQSAFFWRSPFGQGEIPAYQTLDAQVSYKMPELKTILKLGGTNVLNERYTTSIGNPRMGALYYVSVTFDQFLN